MADKIAEVLKAIEHEITTPRAYLGHRILVHLDTLREEFARLREEAGDSAEAFTFTGEVRCPKAGEWFVSGSLPIEPVLAKKDYRTPRIILRHAKVRDTDQASVSINAKAPRLLAADHTQSCLGCGETVEAGDEHICNGYREIARLRRALATAVENGMSDALRVIEAAARDALTKAKEGKK